MKPIYALVLSCLMFYSSLSHAQNTEFLQHWQPLQNAQISHIQANSPCSLYYDITNHYWPNTVSVVHIELSAFQNQTSTFWILVAQESMSNVFNMEAIPAAGYNSFQMDNQISAIAYVVTESGCPCESLDQLEQVVMNDDEHGNLSLPPVTTLTYYLIRVTVTNKVAKIGFREKPSTGELKIDCQGRRITGDDHEVMDWIDDNSVAVYYPNQTCDQALAFCENGEFDMTWPTIDLGTVVSFWISVNHNGGNAPTLTMSSFASQNYFGPSTATFQNLNVVIYEPGQDCGNGCNQLDQGQVSSSNSNSWSMPSNWITEAGDYLLYVEFVLSADNQELNIDYGGINCEYTYPSPEVCASCLPQFVPEAGRKYVISAWVKESSAPLSTMDYLNSYLQVSFIGSTASPISFFPEGQIIDGWQRIEGIIEYPADAVSIQIDPGVNSGISYFDDLRFFPYDGSMKSYVYDPIKLRFIAELDERNFATFYEYDEEGKLTRIKKETERGILTIQESKSSNVKKPNNGN